MLFPCDVNSASSQLLLDDLRHLSSAVFSGRKTNTSDAELSALYLKDRFELLGYSSELQTFSYQSSFFSRSTGNNVIATLTSQNSTSLTVVITAHYDHLGKKGTQFYPGANDNASGVSALLYLAKRLKINTPTFNIIFVATDAEENGLHGSKYFVSQLPTDTVLFNINLDMLAVSARSKTLYAFTLPKLKKTIESQLATISSNDLRVRVSSSSKHMNRLLRVDKIDWRKASDHYSFAKAGIPYIYFGMGDDPHHHKKTDTFANIDQDLYVKSVIYIERFIRQFDFSQL
ncbi:M20/M25/M40 family metallo-hydrolase [Pseudoalteromonas sp. NEC-BIFX-2020_002]|uniref:M20/M25/M40 family metallo-hydrolase n=1 Tax=Pseudoalteromonas sp. NEC-BIFX-2020_002 TaxID=2732353 RepID=UPI002017FFF4|nr:M20/M25/M40 family metallo-hydrolase [Pseudoalteromonas sp. NEC-BIFX-2020_002]